MLVLVTTRIEDCFSRFANCLKLAISICLIGAPALCVGQTDSSGTQALQFKVPRSVSVLENADQTSADGFASGANGTASINGDSSGNATFTAQPLSAAPEAPQDLLTPANPTASFSSPFSNELRGESISTNENPSQAESTTPSEDMFTQGNSQRRTIGDGGQAIGTNATGNPAMQEQRSTMTQLSSPTLSQFNAQQQDGLNRFGNSLQSNQPPINSGSNFSSQPPALSDLRPNSQPISDQPSSWRDVPNGGASQLNVSNAGYSPLQQSSPNVRSFNVPVNQAGNELPPIRSNNGAQGAQSVQNAYNAQAWGQQNEVDNNVRPTGFNQPISNPGFTIDFAKSLMARYSLDNVQDAIPGQPTKLIDLLRQPISAEMRRPMVNQYWETYYDWANLISDQRYEQWLSRIPSGSQSDNSMLEAALAVAANKTFASEIQLGKSQAGLLQYMPNWRVSELLPLPDDLPLIQKYKTNYELYSSRQLMPVSLRGIDQMLPKTLELITMRADAVRVTKTAADQVLAGLSARQTNMMTVLEAGRVWRAAERDLVASVVSYNQAIGDYSLSVTGGYQSPEQVVAMLIAQPKPVAAKSSSDFGQNQNSQANFNRQPQFSNQDQLRTQQPNQQQNSNPGFGNQPVRQAQADPRSFDQSGFGQSATAGQQRQRANNGSGGSSNFNLDANSTFQSNQANRANENANENRTTNGSFTAPMTPLNNRAIGDSGPAGGNGFSPMVPRQASPNPGQDRSAQSAFGPGVPQ